MDIWALGVILFKMLHGHYPFEGDSRKEIFDKIKKGDPQFEQSVLDTTSKCLIGLIRQMLQVDYKQRPTTV